MQPIENRRAWSALRIFAGAVLVLCAAGGLAWWNARQVMRTIADIGGTVGHTPVLWLPESLSPLIELDFSVAQLALEDRPAPEHLFERLDGLPDLAEIRLARCELSPAALAELHDVASLRRLVLDDSIVTEITAGELERLSQIAELRLARSALGDAGLVRLGRLTGLQTLGLSGTEISDKGLSDLAPLPNLRMLDLSHTAITDEGLRALRKHEHLDYLNVTGTRVTDHGVISLQQMMPLYRVVGPASLPAKRTLRPVRALPHSRDLFRSVDRRALPGRTAAT